MSDHYPAHIWQERLGEFSWRCTCGNVHKHIRFPGRDDITFPHCAEAQSYRPDPRCKASMSPGQGQDVRCFFDVGHEDRHRAYDWSWIDGDDDDARLEDCCPVREVTA